MKAERSPFFFTQQRFAAVAGKQRGRHTRLVDLTPPTALLPIFIASLLGSPHCAGMCGGFVAWYSNGSERHTIPHALYSLGRLLSYLTLGVGAAWAGRSLDSATSIARLSALIVGGVLIGTGILKIVGWKLSIFDAFSGRIGSTVGKAIKGLPRIPVRFRPFVIGVVTTLLPCGWLYSFIALAMASADIIQSVLIMTVFWLGTLPVMCALGAFARILTHRLNAFLPRITGVLLIVGGLLSLALHLEHADHAHHHHHESSTTH